MLFNYRYYCLTINTFLRTDNMYIRFQWRPIVIKLIKKEKACFLDYDVLIKKPRYIKSLYLPSYLSRNSTNIIELCAIYLLSTVLVYSYASFSSFYFVFQRIVIFMKYFDLYNISQFFYFYFAYIVSYLNSCSYITKKLTNLDYHTKILNTSISFNIIVSLPNTNI